MSSPSEELSKLVAARLKTDKLIIDSDTASIQVKLANGAMKSEDWKLAVEKELFREGKNG